MKQLRLLLILVSSVSLFECASTINVTTSGRVQKQNPIANIFALVDTGGIRMDDDTPLAEYFVQAVSSTAAERGVSARAEKVSGVELDGNAVAARLSEYGSDAILYLQLTEAAVYPNMKMERGTFTITVVSPDNERPIWKAKLLLEPSDFTRGSIFAAISTDIVNDLLNRMWTAMQEDGLIR